ncbi:MAG: ABC transporter permease [Micromonosporaceae bacterium]|nr:ABC transporter permease [Micromonosporaceae bacterium]
MTTMTRPPAEVVTAPQPPSLTEHARAYWRRLRGGEMGSFPAVLAIIVLATGFGIAKPVFLTPLNFANLLHQSAVYIVAAMALVFVLLIGEIDLAAGWTAGVTAAVMAKLLVNHTVPWYVAILASIVTGVVIGVLLGTLVAKLGVPSFVVTLAAFLAFQGVLLWLVDQGQVILITDPVIRAINNDSLPIWAGWTLYVVSVVAFAAVQLTRRARRARRGVSHDPMSLVVLRILVVAAIAGFGVYALSVNRALARGSVQQGVPIIVPIVVVLLVLLTFVLKRTRFGLHLYALGGNAEATRRAGIPVDRLKIAAFTLCSTLAALAGIIQASRANSVDGKFGSQLILFAVGAAVIGGTSLFGGRGRIIDAVLGGLVVAIIANGMGLLSAPEWVRFVVTGLVLLVAAAVDALARRRSTTVGLR